VKVRADAVPLDGPLAGGVEGGSVVIEPLEAGRAIQPAAYFERERGPLARLHAYGIGVSKDDYVDLPVPAFLVHHPGVGPILIDTGLHPSVARDPRDNLGRLASRLFELEEGADVPSQLRERGMKPADIAVVILTHLHLDHASAISEFPEAVFVVSAPEWEVATERPKLRHGYRPAHYDFGFDYVTVDFDSERTESYGSFGRTIDLFDDGTVRLAFTPGHSEGHMSVILGLPRRDFVVAADAIHYWRHLEGAREPYGTADVHNWERSVRELKAFRQAYPYALIVPGHDPEFWPKLERRYEK
jgi:glyoxylase-like metal-dependent hydrolase (beta-lactamase superfamily II)